MLFSDLSEEETACLAQLELDVWPWVFVGEGSRQDQVTDLVCGSHFQNTQDFSPRLVIGGIY